MEPQCVPEVARSENDVLRGIVFPSVAWIIA